MHYSAKSECLPATPLVNIVTCYPQ